MSVLRQLLRRLEATTNIGLAISRSEIRLVGLNRVGLLVWNRSLPRGRADTSLAEVIGGALAERPASLRRGARLACVVGPAEAQLRSLHGLPQLRSAAEQLAMVAESVDRFFVSEGARMRVSAPVRLREGELWTAAVQRDLVAQVAEACRAHRVTLVGVAPIAAALGHLVPRREPDAADRALPAARVQRIDDGTRLHVHFDAHALPLHVWRERAADGLPMLEGDVHLPERISAAFGDAYAATFLRPHDPFVIAEHADDVRRSRMARRRTHAWTAMAVAGLVATAWVPGAMAASRADRARARLASLAARQRELRRVEAQLAGSTLALNGIASFEASRRSATLLLAELAMALPDSTAITTLHVDSVGGTLTVLAPRAAGTLEAVSALSLIGRVQMTGAVTRETTGGVELERASLRFTFKRRAVATPSRDGASRLAQLAPRGGAE
jgi:Tfp pilus assembly protein PilN